MGWYIYELRKADASLQISTTHSLRQLPRSWRTYLLHVPFGLRVAAIVLLSFALARPQLSNRWQKESTEGIDILMALDISGTMLGVPKTLLRLRPNDEIAIIETGANHPGEIAALRNIVQPDLGLITNVGKAHLEGFGYVHIRRIHVFGRTL